MRKLKFRVWDLENKFYLSQDKEYHFYETHRLTDSLSYWQCPIPLTECLRDEKKYTIQQYTGLHDKNGKEIYEGDIIQLEGAPYVYEVVWNKWHWGIDSKNIVSDFIQSFTGAVEDRAIVIGNIFENPEILK